MPYETRIILDSIAESGARLTTWELTYPRFVHAELMTHRDFSRNAGSSRAIPTKKLIEKVVNDPALPLVWGSNQAGMQAGAELEGEALEKVKAAWMRGRDQMVALATELNDLGLHKQFVNRVIEPWMFITVIVSATNFMNWYGLRAHAHAQPEIGWVAKDMIRAIKLSKPIRMLSGEWHMPFCEDKNALYQAGFSEDDVKLISVARCARVSYETHEGVRDPKKDVGLATDLMSHPHMSPFEHVARALAEPERHGNFIGWKQLRKIIKIPNEAVFFNQEVADQLQGVEGLSVTAR